MDILGYGCLECGSCDLRCHAGIHPDPVDRQTLMKTLPSRNFVSGRHLSHNEIFKRHYFCGI